MKESDVIPPPYRQRIAEFIEELLKSVPCRGILLFGSVAKGTFGWNSDIDLLIVTDAFGEDCFERLNKIYRFSKGKMEFFIYTVKEIEKMFLEKHGLLLEALADGIALYDPDGLLGGLKDELKELIQARSLIRLNRGWKISSD